MYHISIGHGRVKLHTVYNLIKEKSRSGAAEQLQSQVHSSD